MSRSKSKLSIVIALTALLTIILALVLPQISLRSQTHLGTDFTYIFGFTSTFGGKIVPIGSELNAQLGFNVGAFLPLLFVLIAGVLLVVFDKQFSSYVFGAILFTVSGILFIFSNRFVLETNGFITGFTNYVFTSFGTYVALGLCCVGLIECCIGAYLIKSDTSRRYR